MPAEEVEIRAARADDAEAIAALSGELGYPSSAAQAADRLASLIGREENGIFVAAPPGGAVFGWIHVFITHLLETDPFAELGGFVVTADRRGGGIGKRLMAEAEGWVMRHGIAKMKIRSRSTRHDAHAFYERLGYRVDKTQRVFEKDLHVTTNRKEKP